MEVKTLDLLDRIIKGERFKNFNHEKQQQMIKLRNDVDLISQAYDLPTAENYYNCGSGYVKFACPDHMEHEHVVAVGCKERRICSTCGEFYNQEQRAKIRQKLHAWSVNHAAYIVFTTPLEMQFGERTSRHGKTKPLHQN